MYFIFLFISQGWDWRSTGWSPSTIGCAAASNPWQLTCKKWFVASIVWLLCAHWMVPSQSLHINSISLTVFFAVSSLVEAVAFPHLSHSFWEGDGGGWCCSRLRWFDSCRNLQSQKTKIDFIMFTARMAIKQSISFNHFSFGDLRECAAFLHKNRSDFLSTVESPPYLPASVAVPYSHYQQNCPACIWLCPKVNDGFWNLVCDRSPVGQTAKQQ